MYIKFGPRWTLCYGSRCCAARKRFHNAFKHRRAHRNPDKNYNDRNNQSYNEYVSHPLTYSQLIITGAQILIVLAK